MKIAFVFPGQGSQYVGMGRQLIAAHPIAKRIYERADQALGFPLSRIMLEGPDEELKRTEHTQPALLTASIAYAEVLREKGLAPDVVAGHSLGEYSALVSAGALNFEEACRLVRDRGRFMQSAVAVGEGAMAAMIGLELDKADGLIAAVRRTHTGVLAVAGCNSPGQVVLSGEAKAVQEAVRLSREHGVRKATMLHVSAPFHCPLMKPAEEQMAVSLRVLTPQALVVPYVANANAELVSDRGQIFPLLLAQICKPVLWQQSVELLFRKGVRRFVEVGPGAVLSGLVKRSLTKDQLLEAKIETSDEDGDLARLEELA